MKKVLGIVGSQRKSGNCETFVKEISRHIPEPHELKLLRLPEYQVDPCNGCYACLSRDKCVIDDELMVVLEAIMEADGLIIAAPAYLLGAHSCLKVLLDRGLAFYRHAPRLMRKPAVAVGLAGLENKEGKTLLDIEHFLQGIGAQKKQCQMVKAALPGEVVLEEENRKVAAQMANALFGEPVKREGIPHCPLCGGETFRFLGGNQVHCMLCSHLGTLSMENGVAVIESELSDNDLVLTDQGAMEHFNWLVGMKRRFKENKDELKRVRSEYKDEGEWIPHSTKG